MCHRTVARTSTAGGHRSEQDVLHGLTENHERSLLASVQYAARLIRDCDDVLAGSSGSDPLSRYTKALSAPQEKIARDYLFRLREQLLRALHAVGIQPPPPSIGAVHALRTALMFLDDTFEEMRGRYLRGYGDVPPEAERVLDGVVSETCSSPTVIESRTT